MEKKMTGREYLVVASMLFGLFFGAGNLIFPVSMGQQAGAKLWPALIGFCLTGVGLPLLGIASMGVSESRSLFQMSSRVGRGFAYFFTCALYLSIGPLFAIPRTATVSFQTGIAPFVGADAQRLALCVFSFIFFALVLFFSLRPSGILTWVGRIINPIFLLFLGALIVTAFIRPMSSVSAAAADGNYAGKSFFTGFLEGYNTMDALASLAFGVVLIDAIRGLGVTSPRQVSLCTVRSGVFATLLMGLIYGSLTLLGAQSKAILGVSTDGGTALNLIASHYFGGFGKVILGATITFACLKTSIGLVTSCSLAFSELFPKCCAYRRCALVFSLFAFAVSNIGLTGIIRFSLPALLFLYPLTIDLILLSLLGRCFQYRKCVFAGTIGATCVAAFLDFLNALPAAVQARLPLYQQLAEASRLLPFADIGLGWVVPALLGCAGGLLYARLRPVKCDSKLPQ